MSCDRFSEAITDVACGAPLEEPLATHLRRCTACASALDAERRLLADAESDLAQALALRASGDFAARAGERVQAGRFQRAGVIPWWAVAACAAAAVLAIVFSATRTTDDASGAPAAPLIASSPASAPQPPPRPVPKPAPEPASSPARVAEPARVADARARPRRAVPRTERRITAAVAKTDPELEVLVPPTQARAIARLRELLRTGVLDAEQLPPPPSHAELVIEPLVVPEITIPDINGDDGAGSDGGDTRGAE